MKSLEGLVGFSKFFWIFFLEKGTEPLYPTQLIRER